MGRLPIGGAMGGPPRQAPPSATGGVSRNRWIGWMRQSMCMHLYMSWLFLAGPVSRQELTQLAVGQRADRTVGLGYSAVIVVYRG